MDEPAGSSDVQPPTSEPLPDEIITALLQHGGPRTALNARSASRLMRGPAETAIETLLAEDGLLPPQAWDVFTAATALVTRHATHNSKQHRRRYIANIIKLFPTLPQRLRKLAVEGTFSFTESQSQQLVEAIKHAACSSTLDTLVLQPSVSPAAADSILQSLPALSTAELRVHNPDEEESDEPWVPSANLTNLTKCTIHGPESVDISVDLSGFSGATNITHLSLLDASSFNGAALSSLVSLQHLCFGYPVYVVPYISHLQDLQSVEMPTFDCFAGDWEVLASLPKLQTLAVRSIMIEEATPASITSLRVCAVGDPEDAIKNGSVDAPGSIWYGVAPEARVGCMARLLPQLQQLCWYAVDDLPALLAALRGHTALRSMSIVFWDEDEDDDDDDDGEGMGAEAGPGGSWQALPALRNLSVMQSKREGLLADIAGCSGLESLCYAHAGSHVGVGVTGADLVELMSGPCGQSLVAVELQRGLPFSVIEVAALVKGLQRMAVLKLPIEVPRRVTAAQQVEEWLPGMLRRAGVSCRCVVTGVGELGEGDGDSRAWGAKCKLEIVRS